MAAEGVPKGYFVTTGDFFANARAFANGKAITLVDGPAVIERIRKLPDEQQEDLYRLATYGDYQTPSCPTCGRKLVRRITKKGRHPGDEFWGCSGFPKCRYRMRMSQGKATGIGNAGRLPSLHGLKATGFEDDDS